MIVAVVLVVVSLIAFPTTVERKYYNRETVTLCLVSKEPLVAFRFQMSYKE